MSKRFTETGKWDDPWYGGLSQSAMLLWEWLFSKCDNAGVIEPNWDLALFQIKAKRQKLDDLLAEIGDRIEPIDDRKFLLPKFLHFQYGAPNQDCRAHGPIFKSLEKHGLVFDSLSHRVSIDYENNPHTLPGRDKDKVKDKEETKEKAKDAPAKGKTTEEFEQFWALYPKRKSKADAFRAWKQHRGAIPAIAELEPVLVAQCRSGEWTKDGGQFIPNPATWIRGHRWLDELNGTKPKLAPNEGPTIPPMPAGFPEWCRVQYGDSKPDGAWALATIRAEFEQAKP